MGAAGGARSGIGAGLGVVDGGPGKMGAARVGTNGALAAGESTPGLRGDDANGDDSFGGGGSIGGSGPARIGSLRIIASRPSNVPAGARSSCALGTMSPSESRSSVESASEVRPFAGWREKRVRKRETAEGAGAACGGVRSSAVKKSGPAL
jgi:hypothetical protein